MSVIGSGVTAVLAGVLDGLGASRDQNAGRHWDTPGIGVTGTPVLDYGWAPGVQIASLVLGIAAQNLDKDWGRGLTAAGAGMVSRAVAYKIAQKGATQAQGYTAPNPRDPQSHYVSTFGFRQPPFVDYEASYEGGAGDRFGGRVSGYRVPPFDELGGRVSGFIPPPVPPGTPGRSEVSNNFGYHAPNPDEPESHYVSTYGALAPG